MMHATTNTTNTTSTLAADIADIPASPDLSATDLVDFLVFRLGQQEYAVDLKKVQEMRAYDELTRVMNDGETVDGVVMLRGVIMPMVDMRVRAEFARPDFDNYTAIIILNLSSCVIAMAVDQAVDLIKLSAVQISSLSNARISFNNDFLIGSISFGQRSMIVVDIDKLMGFGEQCRMEANGIIESAQQSSGSPAF